jgi:oligopeptide transport system substrate-binding protein
MKKIALLLLVLGLLAAGSAFAEVTFRVLNGAEPPSLDPSLSEDNASHNILMALFDGLLIYDPKTNDGIPGMAESYTISADGKQYNFKIRKNAAWSDGVPITAKTFVDSWLYTLDPKTASPYAWLMAMVVEGAQAFNEGSAGPEAVKIRALDDYTFQVDMVGPVPYVSSMLPHTIFACLPLHAIEKYGDKWTLPENIVTNGAFLLKEWKPQDHVTVVKNPKYWDAKSVKLDKIIYIPSDDNNTRLNMYLNGEADWLFQGIPLDQIDAMKVRKDYQVIAQAATYFYEFNHTTAPFNNVKLRKALAMAIDKKKLVELVTRGGQIPTDAVTPAVPGYVPPKGNAYNVEAAKKLLAEAGYPGGKGFPAATILYNTSEGHKKIAEYVQQQWSQNLGIQVNIENAEWKTVLDRGKNQDFQILRMGWIGDYQDPNTFLELFQTDAGQNYGKYSNKTFDELIQKAARMKAGADRFKTLQQAEAIFIAQDQGIIPIYHYTNLDLIDTAKWGGWYRTSYGWHPPKFIFKK